MTRRLIAVVCLVAGCGGGTDPLVADARTAVDAAVNEPTADAAPTADGTLAFPDAAADAPLVLPDAPPPADAPPPPIDAAPPDAAGPPVGALAERALAQEGLAIALASTVLQSQLQIFFLLEQDFTGCDALEGGGSIKAGPTGNPRTVTVYFDTACVKPYVVGVTMLTSAPTPTGHQYDISETASYFGPGGEALGSLVLTETAVFPADIQKPGDHVVLHGLGTFSPQSGATPVKLGLECSIATGRDTTDAACAGGIVQDFPLLGRALGSVTPLLLSEGAGDSIDFAGTDSTVVIGPPGSLTLTSPTPTTLAIGGGLPFGATDTKGSAAQFVLFPPTPTGWTITDKAHDLKLTVTVVDEVKRNSEAKIVRLSTGAPLVTAAVDQSGTGTIHWSDGSDAAVTSWTLAD